MDDLWLIELERISSSSDPARVTFTPTVQYLPFRLAGVIQCYLKANPPMQYVTWTKDKRVLEPYQIKDVVVMNNGSLLLTRVNENHQVQPQITFGELGFFFNWWLSPRASTRALPTMHTAPKALRGKWRFWWKNLPFSLSSLIQCTRTKWENRLRCNAKLLELKAPPNRPYNGKEGMVSRN